MPQCASGSHALQEQEETVGHQGDRSNSAAMDGGTETLILNLVQELLALGPRV